eukprot:8500856-Pyramimonas_sp.AAC.1
MMLLLLMHFALCTVPSRSPLRLRRHVKPLKRNVMQERLAGGTTRLRSVQQASDRANASEPFHFAALACIR